MSQIIPSEFPQYMTDSEVYMAANQLPVDYFRFAEAAGYDGRIFGVRNHPDMDPEDEHTFIVNACLRSAIWRTLFDVTQQTEKLVGYNLSPRYHMEPLQVPRSGRWQLHWPGVEAVNVRPLISAVLRTGTLSQFVQVDAPVTVDSPHIYIDVSRDVVQNPRDALLRSSLNDGIIPTISGSGYPKRIGDNWRLYVNRSVYTFDTVNEHVNVQHSKYMTVEIEAIEDVELTPVYPGTTQKIPLARPTEVLDDGFLRYWFYNYTLVDPAFYDEPVIDLLHNEFYKLHQTVEFRAFTETSAEVRIVSDEETPRAWKGEWVSIDSRLGLVELNVLGEWVVNPNTQVEELKTTCACIPFCSGVRYTAFVHYKTSPEYLPERARRDISALHRAILHRGAADLPMTDCGCEAESGFIAKQRETYSTSMITPNGLQLLKTKYGDLHGHAVYAEILDNAAIMKVRLR